MTEKEREQIALYRFSVISPILTGQEKNASSYFERVSAQKQQVPVYGEKDYSPKTMADWLSRYHKLGFETEADVFRVRLNKLFWKKENNTQTGVAVCFTINCV